MEPTTTTTLVDGNVVTTVVTTVAQADYIAAENAAITQLQSNNTDLNGLIDANNATIAVHQANIAAVS